MDVFFSNEKKKMYKSVFYSNEFWMELFKAIGNGVDPFELFKLSSQIMGRGVEPAVALMCEDCEECSI